MKIHPPGSTARLADVPDGACFAFRHHEIPFVAIKLTTGLTVAVLWPCHPSDPSIRSGLLDNENVPNASLLVLPNAFATPKQTLAGLRMSPGLKHEPGLLALSGDALYVTIFMGSGKLGWVNLATGDLFERVPTSAIWFTEWEISAPDSDGKSQLLCSIPDERSIAQAAQALRT